MVIYLMTHDEQVPECLPLKSRVTPPERLGVDCSAKKKPASRSCGIGEGKGMPEYLLTIREK
jgi:hypothetical protein